jgi:hypothetical protein
VQAVWGTGAQQWTLASGLVSPWWVALQWRTL